MKTINIELSQDYGSFNNGFKCLLEGELIIITGVNGSGKSQLLSIIRKFNPLANKSISASILLNKESIEVSNVEYRSFKDYIKLHDFETDENFNKTESIKNYIWDAWNNKYNKLNIIAPTEKYKRSLIEAKKYINIKHPSSSSLTESQIKNSIPDEFLLERDDIFSSNMEEVFKEHAIKSLQNSSSYNESNAPWTKLNKLFSDLNFDYRFKNNYSLNLRGSLEGEIKIYPHPNLDQKEPRNLRDLSDGEKAIISLSFASLKEEDKNLKLLLLDEYDCYTQPVFNRSAF